MLRLNLSGQPYSPKGSLQDPKELKRVSRTPLNSSLLMGRASTERAAKAARELVATSMGPKLWSDNGGKRQNKPFQGVVRLCLPVPVCRHNDQDCHGNLRGDSRTVKRNNNRINTISRHCYNLIDTLVYLITFHHLPLVHHV